MHRQDYDPSCAALAIIAVNSTTRRLFPLSSKLALWFAAFAIGMSFITAGIVEDAATSALQAKIGSSLGDLAHYTTQALDRSLGERYNDVRILASQSDIIDGNDAPEVRQQALEQMQSLYKHYAWLGVTDPKGKVIAATSGILLGADVSARPWWSNAQKGIHLGDVHGALLLESRLPYHSGEPWRFVDIAFPYTDRHGHFAGVVGAHLSWDWAREIEQEIFSANRDHGNVDSLVLQRDGTVLLGPPDLQGKKLQVGSATQAASDRSGFVVENWPDGHRYLVGFSHSARVMGESGLDWSVLVRQDASEAFAPVAEIRKRVLWSGLGFALLASLVGWLNARRITRPLAALANSAVAVRSGTSQVIEAPAFRYREIEALTTSMQGMVANIQKQRADLFALNLTLEARVRDRTEALALSESRLRMIADSMPALIAYVDRDLRYRFCNRMYQEWFGKQPDEVLNHTVKETIGPDLFPVIEPPLHRALAGENVEFEYTRPYRGGEQYVKATFIPDYGDSEGSGSREVRGLYIMAQDISEMKRIQLDLERDVLHDTLTGLPNRQALLLQLDRIAKRSRRYQSQYAILFLDIDRFKVINDERGHHAGDIALIAFAQRLKSSVRENDTVARLAGDEFVIVVEDVLDDGTTVRQIADKIIAAVAEPVVMQGLPIQLSTSIGIALPTHPGEPVADVLRRADKAMYQAKAAGRNRIRIAREADNLRLFATPEKPPPSA